ncbi:MAG: hypothetical protein FWD60_04060 [Candidatus Azobacteroides sp.]|nr:hypothetical protein [Candidatus Azobacteroides sp.]
MAKQGNSTPKTGDVKGQVREGHRIGDGNVRGSYQPTRDTLPPPPSSKPSSDKPASKK